MNTKKRNLKFNQNSKAGSFYILSNFIDKGIVLLTIPIFSRLMSTTDYGIVNTYLSWVTMISIIIGFSMGNSIRSAVNDYHKEINSYISSIIALAILNFLVLLAVVILAYSFIEIDVDIMLVVLCLIQALSTFVINLFSIYYMMNKNYVKKTLLQIIPGVIIVLVSIVLLLILRNRLYLGRIIPYVFVTLLIAIFLYCRTLFKSKIFLKIKYWFYALKISFPLIFHGLSLTILSVSDRTIITYFISSSATGIYSLIYSFSMIAIALSTAFESVWIPWFHSKMDNGEKKDINNGVLFYIDLVTIVIFSIILAGPELLKVLAPKEYWEGTIIISPIIVATFLIFLYSIMVDLEYYYKSTKFIAINTMIAALTNIFLNILFIPKYGYQAAAYTTLISYFISFLLHNIHSRKLDNELFNIKIFMLPIFIIILTALISSVYINDILFRWALAIILALIYLIKLYKQGNYKLLLVD